MRQNKTLKNILLTQKAGKSTKGTKNRGDKQQEDRFKLNNVNNLIKCKWSTYPNQRAETVRLDLKNKT